MDLICLWFWTRCSRCKALLPVLHLKLWFFLSFHNFPAVWRGEMSEELRGGEKMFKYREDIKYWGGTLSFHFPSMSHCASPLLQPEEDDFTSNIEGIYLSTSPNIKMLIYTTHHNLSLYLRISTLVTFIFIWPQRASGAACVCAGGTSTAPRSRPATRAVPAAATAPSTARTRRWFATSANHRTPTALSPS